MERVLGIGGLFFRSKDPGMLAEWYERHLGVNRVPERYEDTPWMQDPGPTIFAPTPADADFFGGPERVWMINFRVRNLEAMVEQLREAGVEVDLDPEIYPNGRFASLSDPEGNQIQLWQFEEP